MASQQQIDNDLASVLQGSSQTYNFSGNNTGDFKGCPPEGFVNYGTRDANNGRRATGAEACLTQESVENGSSAQQRGVPGYKWAQEFATADLGADSAQFSVNACHLLGDQLGGKGKLANLATCGRSTNASKQDPNDPGRDGPITDFENRTRKEVDRGQQVLYRVEPEYLENRTVPYAFVMQAVGSTGIVNVSVVPNVIFGANQGDWVNIGLNSCSEKCTSPLPTPGVK